MVCKSQAGAFTEAKQQNNSDTKASIFLKRAHGSIEPVMYSASAVSSLRRTRGGFVLMGGLKLSLTLKPT